MTVKWLDKPEDHDYQAATDYLTLVGEADLVKRTVKALRNATLEYRKAKDILRAARLEMLPKTNAHVARDLAKIAKDKALSPILLVRGDARSGARLKSPMVITGCAPAIYPTKTLTFLAISSRGSSSMSGFGFPTLAIVVIVGMIAAARAQHATADSSRHRGTARWNCHRTHRVRLDRRL